MLHCTFAARPHRGRRYAALFDMDGRSVYHHGIVVFPPRERNPLKVIDRIYRETVAANPEEWMYDDILAALRTMGCEIIRPHCWVEPC